MTPAGQSVFVWHQRHFLRAALLLLVLLCGAGAVPDRPPIVFLVGDSTMADKEVIGTPERGWGMFLPLFLRDEIVVENHARNGRSTRSFLAEGRWDVVLQRLHRGDVVMIQFGHNDAKREDSTRYAEAQTVFRANLVRFVRDARDRGALPLLLTPVCRHAFTNGVLRDTHGAYPSVVRAVGEEEQVPVLDLEQRTRDLLTRIGEDSSASLYLRCPPGMFSRFPEGKVDNTHFTSLGAWTVAGYVADEMRRLRLPEEALLRTERPFPPTDARTIVLLDCYFNNEWRPLPGGGRERYHYVWQDTTNSGFSILGKRIVALGASLDTLCGPPTSRALQRASLYLIVDPDTPRETDTLHLMDSTSLHTLVDWVRQGGVLMLMGNDRGNAEFEHFNMLAEQFGIHFNEDSRNRVQGKEYATGAFSHLPRHPLFQGLDTIFLKEISTLRLTPPAEPVLVDGRDTIMAFARLGRGAVFAVGDPWLYDEYMDHRRLPSGYQNAEAATNLFRWLLQYARPVGDR